MNANMGPNKTDFKVLKRNSSCTRNLRPKYPREWAYEDDEPEPPVQTVYPYRVRWPEPALKGRITWTR
jgi:hypothetical protein